MRNIRCLAARPETFFIIDSQGIIGHIANGDINPSSGQYLKTHLDAMARLSRMKH